MRLKMIWRLSIAVFLLVGVYLVSLSRGVVYAQGEDPNCPGAPVPMLVVGGQGQVVPGDANNVRDTPAKSGNKTGAIPGGEVFDVLEGPVCTDGLNWWQVDYEGLNGWTVEGQGTEYWVVPYDPAAPTSTPLPPTETPAPTATTAPAVVFEAPRPVINVLEPGVQARVISDNPKTSEIRVVILSDPDKESEILGSLAPGESVTVLSDASEADGIFWRQIETFDGQTGWVAEGFLNADRGQEFERTLLPQCPITDSAERIAFYIGVYLYTANPDGSDACILDKLLLTPPHTFYPYFAYFPGQLLWLPDHSAISYIDYLDFDSSPTPIFQDFFVLNTDGSQRRQVTNGNDVYWADWSPDGQRLLLSQSINGRGEPQIWTMKIDGNAYGALTSGDHRKVWGGWLADSESVIYVENIGEFKNQIGPTEQEFIFYTVNVTSGGLKELYRTNEEVTDTQLAPDRSKVVISSWELTPIEGSKYFDYTGFNTILLDVITGETTPLPKACYNPLWLPDSSGIICLDDVYDDNAITVTRLEDLTPEVIELEHPLSDTDRGFTWDMGWLPDGRLLMLTTGNSVLSTDADQLLAVNLSDGTITTVIGAVGEED